jgi:hypothetical protein
MASKLLTLTLLLATTLAKTDIGGCTSSDFVVTPTGGGTPFASRIFYIPDTGEICELLDCGGGRAPPKTTVPGCPLYSGTETYSPRFLPSSTSTEGAEATTTGTNDEGAAPTESEGEGSSSRGSTATQTSGGASQTTAAGGSGGAALKVYGPAVVGGAVLAGLAMV